MSQRPDDAYLAKIGTVAYLVADIEWLLLGDLQSFQSVVPADLTVASLSGKTTYDIANKVRARARLVADADVAAYLTTGANALGELAPKRNAVFHARPASIGGQNRLNRWVARTKDGETKVEAFGVTDEWLDDVIKEAETYLAELEPLRAAAHRAYPLEP